MKQNLKEDSIIGKTGPDGETSFEAVPEDVAQQLNGTTQTDVKGNRTSIKDTGRKTMGEAEGQPKLKLNQQDLLNLTKDLDVCTREALRAVGDNVAYTQQFFNKNTNSIIIVVSYQDDADNPGKPSSQRYSYKLAQGKVMLDLGDGKYLNVAAIDNQSGTVSINRDLAINSIQKAVSKKISNATGQAGSEEKMLEEFGKAVDKYRAGKSKETIKELFRAARNFPGDDIQHKFANAVQAYKGIEPQTCSPSDPRCEDNCDIHMTESLFIRLLEFAKEDAKDDVDLHKVAEGVSRACNEKGCADIDDYGTIMGDLLKPEAEPEPEEECQLQESEADEIEDYSDYVKTPEDIRFYFNPETKEIFDDWTVDPNSDATFVTGMISCTETGVEDQSFSHEFGIEKVKVNVCTDVQVDIDGFADKYDHYLSPEDKDQAESMIDARDRERIRQWGINWMTDHLED